MGLHCCMDYVIGRDPRKKGGAHGGSLCATLYARRKGRVTMILMRNAATTLSQSDGLGISLWKALLTVKAYFNPAVNAYPNPKLQTPFSFSLASCGTSLGTDTPTNGMKS